MSDDMDHQGTSLRVSLGTMDGDGYIATLNDFRDVGGLPKLLSFITDSIDPAECALYYRGDHSDRHPRRLCSLGDVRAMARICARFWAQLEPEDKSRVDKALHNRD